MIPRNDEAALGRPLTRIGRVFNWLHKWRFVWFFVGAVMLVILTTEGMRKYPLANYSAFAVGGALIVLTAAYNAWRQSRSLKRMFLARD